MENTEIRIQPNGWIKELVFQLGYFRCGKEEYGYGIYVADKGEYAPGGVISREDMAKLVKIFQKRLKEFPLT